MKNGEPVTTRDAEAADARTISTAKGNTYPCCNVVILDRAILPYI